MPLFWFKKRTQILTILGNNYYHIGVFNKNNIGENNNAEPVGNKIFKMKIVKAASEQNVYSQISKPITTARLQVVGEEKCHAQLGR